MPIDPTPFLATVVGTSVTLAAIVGGLLVARFVSMDSDQRTSRKVLADARERLDAARARAAAAWREILDRDAEDFFWSAKVIDAITHGVTAPHDLIRVADWEHSEDDLRPYAEHAAAEYRTARDILPSLAADPYVRWDDFRRNAADLPPIRWPRIWEHVYDEITIKLAAEEDERRRADRRRPGTAGGLLGPMMDNLPLFDSRALVRGLAASSSMGAISGRRYESLLTDHQVALQQVQDYEGELRRLESAHAEIVRPDARLWWGVGIVVAFAATGIALPLWIMAQGPQDLASVRWLFWVFAGVLAALLAYIVVYLAQLTRAKSSR